MVLTLIELVAVVAILAIVSGFLVTRGSHYATYSRKKCAKTTLVQLRDAIQGAPDKPGYATDTGHVPNNLTDLFSPGVEALFDRDSRLGWRGPYMMNGSAITNAGLFDASFRGTSPYDYIVTGDQTLLDPWGNPFIIQRLEVTATQVFIYKRDGVSKTLLGSPPAGFAAGDYSRLISAGPNGVINTAVSAAAANLLPSRQTRGDDLVIFLTQPDPDPLPPSATDPDLE